MVCMSRATEIVSRSPPARCHGQIRAGHLKHLPPASGGGTETAHLEQEVRTELWRKPRLRDSVVRFWSSDQKQTLAAYERRMRGAISSAVVPPSPLIRGTLIPRSWVTCDSNNSRPRSGVFEALRGDRIRSSTFSMPIEMRDNRIRAAQSPRATRARRPNASLEAGCPKSLFRCHLS